MRRTNSIGEASPPSVAVMRVVASAACGAPASGLRMALSELMVLYERNVGEGAEVPSV